MKLSVVTTLYNSETYIDEFLRKVNSSCNQIVGEDYEIIFVNDGSQDKSLILVLEHAKDNNRIRIIDLSRNFGHHKAILTGLSFACGELVFLIDSDLEEDPEWLLNFHQLMNEKECDVVFGIQESRKGRLFERISGALFYILFNSLTEVKIPASLVTARLMTRRYVDALLKHEEKEVFLAGLWQLIGFVQIPYLINKKSNMTSRYSLKKKWNLAIDAVVSFSIAPLRLVFKIGILMNLISIILVTILLINRFVNLHNVPGWTSILASLWLVGGAIVSSIGILGIYLSRIFLEVKNRPITVVRAVYGRQEN